MNVNPYDRFQEPDLDPAWGADAPDDESEASDYDWDKEYEDLGDPDYPQGY